MKSLWRQQRAYKTVRSWTNVRKDAVETLQGYPVDLRALGTLQMIAFSIGKSTDGHPAIARAIADWVLSKESGAPLGAIEREEERTPSELFRRLAERPREAYVAADAEAIAFADALKVIGKALLKGD